MSFAANFIAIDFETANRRSDSACQLAAVVVRDGEIAESKMWMIRPEPFYFSPFNIDIHGISPDQVSEQPNFAEHWDDIASFLTIGPRQKMGARQEEQMCLVAHNAAFDVGVLTACLKTHHLQIPEFGYTCTRSIARQTWPRRPRFGLKPLSDWLGHTFRHHDALEDSVACAKILLAAGIQRQATSIDDLEKKLRLSRGTAGPWGKKGPKKSNARPRSSAAPKEKKKDAIGNASEPSKWFDLQRLMIRAEFIRPLSGKTVVFTGQMKGLTRREAELLAVRLGGNCSDTLSTATDLLIVGDADHSANADHSADATSVHEETAKKYQASGQPIRILSEDEFLGLIISTSNEAQ
ncbi:DNA polymerase III subunit epsilon [Planctomycetes bacterium CA13]|uniref:DNA polymerase III subunit epsilon n=1 Tax=Novipirellula herctigrandis TaxID=2527986 RepID=A0A5C5Z0Q5_9BACT|nr:DNA polymerase III subunit epsilon [Planctomycetes bacterium CA13]